MIENQIQNFNAIRMLAKDNTTPFMIRKKQTRSLPKIKCELITNTKLESRYPSITMGSEKALKQIYGKEWRQKSSWDVIDYVKNKQSYEREKEEIERKKVLTTKYYNDLLNQIKSNQVQRTRKSQEFLNERSFPIDFYTKTADEKNTRERQRKLLEGYKVQRLLRSIHKTKEQEKLRERGEDEKYKNQAIENKKQMMLESCIIENIKRNKEKEVQEENKVLAKWRIQQKTNNEIEEQEKDKVRIKIENDSLKYRAEAWELKFRQIKKNMDSIQKGVRKNLSSINLRNNIIRETKNNVWIKEQEKINSQDDIKNYQRELAVKIKRDEVLTALNKAIKEKSKLKRKVIIEKKHDAKMIKEDVEKYMKEQKYKKLIKKQKVNQYFNDLLEQMNKKNLGYKIMTSTEFGINKTFFNLGHH